MANENGRNLAGVVAELKDELKEFANTRFAMLKSEMKDKVGALKVAAPLIAIGLILLVTAWFVLTAALVALVALAFRPNPYAYFISLAIVGVAYLLIGGAFAALAKRELTRQGFMPVRTIKVLKEDQIWLQNEARQQL